MLKCIIYFLFAQVIIATVISATVNLHDRFKLPIIEDLGGIAPRHWYAP